jgi:hypothetical protein
MACMYPTAVFWPATEQRLVMRPDHGWAAWHAQEKVLAQVEREAKSAPPKPKKEPKPRVASVADALSFKAGEPGEPDEAEEEEEEDPVEAALAKYGIITENPWEKGVKCAARPRR